MRILEPDTSLWDEMTDLLDLVGGMEAVALTMEVVALMAGVTAWAWGHFARMDRLAVGGKFCVVGVVTAAVVTTALPGWLGWLLGAFA